MLLFKWWISDQTKKKQNKKPLYSLPGGLVVTDPPAIAGDTTSSIHPLSGKIPQATGQKSLCATITEHALKSREPAAGEPTTRRSPSTMRKGNPHCHSQRVLGTATKTQCSQKQITFFFFLMPLHVANSLLSVRVSIIQ